MTNLRFKPSKQPIISEIRGFTLVELMIALAMSGIIVAAVYAAYNVQQKSYYTQGQVVEMQQNIRAAMEIMTSDIRMATYGFQTDSTNCKIDNATKTQLRVRIDNDKNGVCDIATLNNENVQFDFTGAGKLQRNNQDIAENIQAIEFCYNLLSKPNDACIVNPAGTDFSEISSVQISILARAGQRDPKYKNSTVYYPASCYQANGSLKSAAELLVCQWGKFDDEIRRRLLTTTVQIRNRGL